MASYGSRRGLTPRWSVAAWSCSGSLATPSRATGALAGGVHHAEAARAVLVVRARRAVYQGLSTGPRSARRTGHAREARHAGCQFARRSEHHGLRARDPAGAVAAAGAAGALQVITADAPGRQRTHEYFVALRDGRRIEGPPPRSARQGGNSVETGARSVAVVDGGARRHERRADDQVRPAARREPCFATGLVDDRRIERSNLRVAATGKDPVAQGRHVVGAELTHRLRRAPAAATALGQRPDNPDDPDSLRRPSHGSH